MIGENIKKLREQKSISINALARECNMSPGYLSDLEKGKKDNPSVETLEKIASNLGITAQQLFKENIEQNDEIDEIEKEIYEKLKNITKADKEKILKMIEIFESNK